MLRLVITVLYVALFLISAMPLFAVTWFLRKKDRKKASLTEFRYVQSGFRTVLRLCGVRVTCTGMENIPKDTAVLYVANHRGTFDIVASYAHLPDVTGFISKEAFGRVPLLGFVMRRLYCLFLDRKDLRKDYAIIRRSFDLIREGISLFIFPEGTRNKNEDPAELLPFHAGSLKAAQRTGCPVIPVAITGADQILEKHFPIVKPGKMTLTFGAPVYYKDLSEDEKKHMGEHFAAVLSDMVRAQMNA